MVDGDSLSLVDDDSLFLVEKYYLFLLDGSSLYFSCSVSLSTWDLSLLVSSDPL